MLGATHGRASARGGNQPFRRVKFEVYARPYPLGAWTSRKESTMRMRLYLTAVLSALLVLRDPPAAAAPEAHILRIDPRASQAEGAPVLTTVIELVQNKRLSEAIAECASLRGDAQLDCQSEKLEAPQALYSPFAPFPEKAAIFTVTVDGADRPRVVRRTQGALGREPRAARRRHRVAHPRSTPRRRWAPASTTRRPSPRRSSASMAPNDIVDVMFFNDRQVVSDSKWQPASAKAQVDGFVNALKSHATRRKAACARSSPSSRRPRPTGSARSATSATERHRAAAPGDGRALERLRPAPTRSRTARARRSSAVPREGALPGRQHGAAEDAAAGRSRSGSPRAGFDEFRANAQEFMQGLANPEIGGFFDIIRDGQGAAQSAAARHDGAHALQPDAHLKWRVAASPRRSPRPSSSSSTTRTTPILGDATFKDVPVGIDPTTWPLDVNIEYTKQNGRSQPDRPGRQVHRLRRLLLGRRERPRRGLLHCRRAPSRPQRSRGTDIEAAKRRSSS